MWKRIIPNACTSANLLFGMCSIIATFEGNLTWAAIFILLALVADGLDGRLARYFGVSSELGKEMDSLCDLGSFGIAPAILAYRFCLESYGTLGEAAAIFFALCGMWRLARFNVSTDVVHGYFMGLAIPAGGCLVATSCMLFASLNLKPVEWGYVYPAFIVIVAYLMVSHVHYPNFKGDGAEPIYKVPKIIAAVLFAAILYLGKADIVAAFLTALFATYAVFGMINSLFAMLTQEN